MAKLKVLELFSGIGGMHFALKETHLSAEVTAAIDINTVANTVYNYNFPKIKLLNKNISSLTSSFIDSLEIDMILMSPPCQPYTRIGKKEDILDRRSDSLAHLIQIIPEINQKFQFLLLENVRGFEVSEARAKLLESLKPSFHIVEFMLNPLQFGIPNSRERYYLLARRKPFIFSSIETTLISDSSLLREHTENFAIKNVLEFPDDSEEYNKYLVPISTVIKRVMIMDIITKESLRSCCFTKAYGRFIEGTGSIYCPLDESKIKTILEKIAITSSNEKQELLETLRLRFFTPKEISRLMCFPKDFKFPDRITNRQKYNLLGNSINVQVVSDLIKLLAKE